MANLEQIYVQLTWNLVFMKKEEIKTSIKENTNEIMDTNRNVVGSLEYFYN